MLGVLSFGLHGRSQERNVALRSCCFLLMVAAPVLGLASLERPSFQRLTRQSISDQERQVWTSAVHDSEFAAVEHPATRPGCEATQPPQALATPDPLVDEPELNAKVTVSFIVGTDGRVHSPLVLASAGSSEDRTILDAVRSWRYRPATCNGVPTDAEAKVEFSSR
jgi:TonB family protein